MSTDSVCMVVKNRLSNDARVKKEMAVLAKDGWQVTVIAMPEAGAPEEESSEGIRILRPPVFSESKQKLRSRVAEASENIDQSVRARVIRYLRKNRLRRLTADLQRDIPWERKLKKTALQVNADVYHANDLDTLEICGSVAAQNRAKLVYDSHELWLESSRYLIATHPLNKIRLKRIEQKYIYRADAVIAVTPMRGRRMQEMYPSMRNLHIVENAPEKLLKLPEKGRLRSMINSEPDDVIALYQGVLCPERGLEELLTAAELTGNPKLKFVFIGMDTWNGTLQQMAADRRLNNRVFFLPPVPSEELPEITVDADMGFILFRNTCLNHYYSLPNKLYEYMMAGVPIVSSDFPELKRVLGEAESGITVDPDSPEEIAEAVERLAANPDMRDRMKENGRKAALSRYNWEPQSEILRNLYRKLR
ncbi:MAG: glycosyltransferase family 4 protein [Candidatus Fermentibacteraceae bacterium]|nr:glycosyltransferase family 4 protein [Candidatus Fermentibacteraceae bacterium]